MAGLAILFDTNNPGAAESEFGQFARRVQDAKRLAGICSTTTGYSCAGAKFDTAASLHRGVTMDATSGSWLIAAGTVVDTADPSTDGKLDTLLRDYIAQGQRVLSRLDGVFVLAIYNGYTRSLAIVSDPFGFFSVFYGERGGCTFIGTSALAVAQQIQATPSDLGIQCFLRTGQVFGEMTLWQEVKRLVPATVLQLSEQGVKESIYWTPTLDESLSKLDLSDAVYATAQTIPALLKRNLGREGKVWSDLTGGFDTRFLDVLIERAQLPFKADFVGPDDHPDVQIAKTIVKRSGWEHEHFELPRTWVQDSPEYLEEALYRGDAQLNILLMLRPIWVHHRESAQFSSLLNGLGGEMWRGLNWWSERAAIGRTTRVHYERQLWSLMHPIPEEILIDNSRTVVQAELTRQFRAVGERHPDARNTFKLDSVWAYRETGHTGAWTTCATGLLRVVPALFSKDIVSFVMSLDYRWRVSNSLVRHWLNRYRPVLSRIEVEGRGPAEPVRLDNWQRFIPSRLAWSRKALDKAAQVALRKSLWKANRPVSYSRVEWRQAMLRHVADQALFDPALMRSGDLYRQEQLASFLSQAQTATFKHEEFLGRIMTVEMALREGEKTLQPA